MIQFMNSFFSKFIMRIQVSIVLTLFLLSFHLSYGEIEETQFPKWLEKNFEWKNQGKISNTEFLDGLSWLIESKTIVIPTEPPMKNTSDKILEIKENWQESFVVQIYLECDDDSRCAVKELQRLVLYKEHPNSIMKTYYDLMDHYKKRYFSCHPESHDLAEFLYGYLGDVSLALDFNDPLMCGGGNYHGIVYSHLKSQVILNDMDPQKVDISKICPNDPLNEQTIARWECIHGVGHGLTKINNFDVFPALERCEEFEKDWERVSCSKGLFMENIDNFNYYGTGTFSKEDLFFPCNKLEQELSPPCYHYQARHVYVQNKFNFTSSFEKCETAPPGFEKYCYRGLGSHMGISVKGNPDFSKICLDAKTDFQEFCYLGIAMKFADNRSIKEALKFCSTIPNDFQTSCYGEVGKWIKMVYDEPSERLEACLVSNNLKYFEACIKADFEKLSIL